MMKGIQSGIIDCLPLLKFRTRNIKISVYYSFYDTLFIPNTDQEFNLSF